MAREPAPSLPSEAAQARRKPRPAGTAYWRRVLKHRFGIIGLSVVCGLAAALIAGSLDPLYEAEVTILVDTQGKGLGPVPDDRDGGRISSSDNRTVMRTQILLIESRTLAESVSDQLGLWDDPEFDPSQIRSLHARPQLDWTAWVADFFPRSQPAPATTEEQTRATTIAAVRKRLTVEAIPDSQVIRLGFAARDPTLAARIANAFAGAYLATGTETGPEPAGRDGAPDPAGNQIPMLSQRLDETRARNDDLQELHDQVQRAGTLSTADLIAHPILARNIVLQSLKASELEADRQVSELAKRYGPMHPRMVEAQSELDAVRAMLATEIGNALAGLAQELTTGRAQAEKLEGELRALQTPTQDGGPRAPDLPPVQQQSETDGHPNDGFTNRFEDTAQDVGRGRTQARIIDAAQVPTAPVEPDATKMIGVAALLGLVAGLAIAMLSAYRDNTLRDPEEVEGGLELPMLGTVPRSRRRRRKKVPLDRMFADQPRSPFAEAIRTLRTGIVLSNRADHRVVLVTSSIRGEGATTVAINLALALGQLDKVLLIDADLRQGLAAGRLGLPAETPGLSDLVAGTAEESACIHHVAGLNIDILPAGAVPPDPLEVLSSRQFAQTLDRLRERYARIVIDSAPAQAVSDALMLSRACDAVVLVIRAGKTPLPLIQTTLKRLRQVAAPVVGGVLNEYANGQDGEASQGPRFAGRRRGSLLG